jgi:hypothetical protein
MHKSAREVLEVRAARKIVMKVRAARENKMGNVGNNVTCVTFVSVRSLPKKRS